MVFRAAILAGRFIRTLKIKIYKYMISVLEYVYMDKLGDKVNKYNNTYHRTFKMKPTDVKSSTYIDSSKEINDKNPKFKISDNVRKSKFKNIFAKGYVSNCSEEVFVIKKVKNTVPWTYVISDLNGEEIVGTFYEKELQEPNQKQFRAEKALIRKGNKLGNGKAKIIFFNSWID